MMRVFAVLCLIAGLTLVDHAQTVPGGPSVLAWLRAEQGEQYRGKPYFFLGSGEMQLTIDVAPQAGQTLELLWGAKKDTRSATITINGKPVQVKQGGYDGYQWVPVPMPEGLSGQKYDVKMQAGSEGKAAFMAEIRLTSNQAAAPLDLKPPAFRIAMTRSAATRPSFNGEAFPEMRKFWDRPAAAAKLLADARQEALFQEAEKNGRAAAEALYRCRRFVDGWLANADPKTGLIPRNLTVSRDFWNGRDSAADNYPFMVLTCALTDRALFNGRMLDMLRTETKLTCRVDRLPDDYSFSKQGWRREQLDLDALIFDGSEYVKDGLIPLTEWLGQSPWLERAIGITDDVWKNAQIDTPFGKIPTLNFEVNGDLLQACSRLYFVTGDRKYLDWAMRLGDYYLLGDHHPTRNMTQLRLSDHGCEVVNGLTELYVACSVAAPEKREAYRKPMHEMFDSILAAARNDDGMLYSSFNPKTGEHSKGICDTWGYNYDGFYTMYLLDNTEAYRDAVRKALSNLKGKYVGAPWDDKSADGYADSIEGAINLYNREAIAPAADWIDSQMRLMWAKQQPSGIIEGWHGDGNGARTSIMYALWKTQGVTIQPWREDVCVGAVRDGQSVCVSLTAEKPWTGRIVFDRPRHKTNMHLPLDYPRINQFPEWFTTQADQKYTLRDMAGGAPRTLSGKELQDGVPVELKAGETVRWFVMP
jgi:hypothetical protein